MPDRPEEPAASPSNGPWYVYIVRCRDDSLYTGIATDPARREREHNGELAFGARYTRARRPVRLVYSERADDRTAAARREHRIKSLTRTAKEVLIAGTLQER